MLIKQSTATQHLVFLMIDDQDHITGKTGLTPTVTLSKNGSAFASPAGAVTEISDGWYKLAAHAADSDTLGPLALHATASGADPVDMLHEVIACNLLDATALGLSRLDATISSRSTYAGADTSGTATLLGKLPDTLSLSAIATQLGTVLTTYDPPTQSELAAAMTQIKGSGWDEETDTLAALASQVASIEVGEAAVSAADIADAVWDEALASHTAEGSAGESLQNVSASEDPLGNAVAGSYEAGTAGDALSRIFEIKTIVQAGGES